MFLKLSQSYGIALRLYERAKSRDRCFQFGISSEKVLYNHIILRYVYRN